LVIESSTPALSAQMPPLHVTYILGAGFVHAATTSALAPVTVTTVPTNAPPSPQPPPSTAAAAPVAPWR